MGQPVFLQYPFVGGLDQKTSDTYLSAEQNQASITNGNFHYVGTINKRNGIWFDQSLAAAVVLNPNGILYPYASPSLYSTALSAIGNVILQGPWAWTVESTTAATAGKIGNFTPTRRPLPIHAQASPLICDGVTALTGTVRALAWISAPDVPVGTSVFSISSAFVDPATSDLLLSFPDLSITAANVTLVNLIWFPNTGILSLFLIVETASSAARELRVYNITPANNDNTWTIQAGATLALYNSDATACDVQPLSGDPSDGYIVLYLPSSTQTQLTWRYFVAYASSTSGTLANTGYPGKSAIHIIADWSIDVAFVWNDNPDLPANDSLHIDYYSADGLFTSLATYSADPSVTAALGDFGYTLWQLGGACRVYDKTNTTLDSEIFVTYWAQDSTYSGSGGPTIPVMMGGVVARSSTSTVTPMGFVYYPYGLRPLTRPVQVVDGVQIAGSYIHVSHPCVQDYKVGSGTNPTAATIACEQVTEYIVDFRIQAESGVPLTLKATEATIAATIAPRQLNPYVEVWSNAMFLPLCGSSDRTSILTALAVAGTGIIGTGAAGSTMWLAETAAAAQLTPVIINDSTELGGSIPVRLTPQVTEHGFVNFPEFIVSDATGTGTLSGTFSYAVCYMRQDADGNVERSSPAVLPTPVTVTSKQVAIGFPKLAWDNYEGGYFVELYRTLDGGSTYYLNQRTQNGNFADGPYGGFVDELPDTTLELASILYTTGGLLDNVNPPAARYHAAHRGRYAIVDETLRSVWFTKQETQGEVLGFNEVLVRPFIEGGDITALASLDDKFVVFKENTIWIQYGDGPADNGQNSDWTTPQLLPSDVGCINAKSVSAAPAGVIFQAHSGFHLLGRDLSVIYIGKAVQDTVAAYPTCVSSVAVPSAKQIRWCMQAEGGAQIVLVYDYFLNQWTTHAYAHLDSAIVCLFLDDGVYSVLTTGGMRYQESATSYLDKDSAAATHFVPLTVVSPWIKVSGQQGYQRHRRTLVYGVPEDPCGLSVGLAFNYDATVQQTGAWSYAALESKGQVSLHTAAAWNKCESVQVTLSDVDSASKVTGQGMSFDAIGLDMDKIGDYYRRLPARLKG